MKTYDEKVALCALNKIFGYHPRLALDLIRRAGTALAVFDSPPSLPDHPELSSEVTPAALEWAHGELSRVAGSGFRFLCLADDDYPSVLRECPDPPLGLYLNGCTSPTEIFGLRPMIGVVGTRDISPYGREWARKLVETMASCPVQPCIVSGLAFGADGIAHRAALDRGLCTIGVMATGIDSIYPWQHEKLACAIVGTPGCALLTDYPLGTAPVALNFLRRNRIVAGLVSAVIVVESRTKGGSLMTARYACDYGREVFAVPGRLDDLRSAGCNSLIHENMARIVTTAEVLAADLGLGIRVRGAGGSWHEGLRIRLERLFGADSPLVALGQAIQEHRGSSVEELSALLSCPYATVLADVGTLEASGVIVTDFLRRCSLAPGWDWS